MNTIATFKALADQTRLQIYSILLTGELNVNELVAVMGMGQSRVSRHLKILTDAGLLQSRRDGLWVFYKAAGESNAAESNLKEILSRDAGLLRDRQYREQILQDRNTEKKQFFNRIAYHWDQMKKDLLGSLDIAAEILPYIENGTVIADMGCGTGELIEKLLPAAQKAIGVDSSSKMLEFAKKRLQVYNDRVDFRIGEIEHLPMRDKEIDYGILSMVLHHLPSPRGAIMETVRVTRKGLIIAEFEKHTQENVRTRYGHRWLGFDRDEIEQWLFAAGYTCREVMTYGIESGMKVNIFVAECNDIQGT